MIYFSIQVLDNLDAGIIKSITILYLEGYAKTGRVYNNWKSMLKLGGYIITGRVYNWKNMLKLGGYVTTEGFAKTKTHLLRFKIPVDVFSHIVRP